MTTLPPQPPTPKAEPARLIPTYGALRGADAEMRVTSVTLAVISVVRDFSAAILNPLGAPTAAKAVVEAFTETVFKLSDGSVVRPDGLIRVTYGKKTFVALIEVKTGTDLLDASQVNSYWDVARENGFDAVLTISNELAVAGVHPTQGLKVRSNSNVKVHHLSWTALVAKAVTCKVHKGVADPEQSWLLGELIRYLESDASGVVKFDDMGPSWVGVRDGARDGVLNRSFDGTLDIVERWDQLLRYAALRLGSEIGADVEQHFPRGHKDPKVRQQAHLESLISTGILAGALKVPDAVGILNVEVDLRARRVTTSMDLDAPSDRGNKAKVSWLLRQLGEEQPSGVEIEAWGRRARQPVIRDLSGVRQGPLCLEDEAQREILRFRVIRRFEMGEARSSGTKRQGFVQSVVGAIDAFYEGVGQQLSPYVPKAPRIRRNVEATPEGDLESPDSDTPDPAGSEDFSDRGTVAAGSPLVPATTDVHVESADTD